MQSNYGVTYFLSNPAGIRNPDGTLFRAGQPLPPSQSPARRTPPNEVASPTLATPYSDQISLGYSWQVNNWLGLNVEAITIDYHDIPFRFRANGRSTPPAISSRPLRASRSSGHFRVWYGGGRGSYDGVNIGIRIRRQKFELQGFYTYSETEGNMLAGADEFRITDRHRPARLPRRPLRRIARLPLDPLCDACFGPFYTDAEHRVNLAGIYHAIWGINLSGVLRYHSANPYTEANALLQDLNGDGFRIDLAPGVDHVNTGRGSEFMQIDLGASKEFSFGDFGIEVIARGLQRSRRREPGDLQPLRRADLVRRRSAAG